MEEMKEPQCEVLEQEINGRRLKLEDRKLFIFKGKTWREKKGTINNLGYRVLYVGGKTLTFHRIIWKLHHPDFNMTYKSGDVEIDHIDRDRANNNIENLRSVTRAQNQWNRAAKGYYFNARSNRFQSYIRYGGKQKHLGCYDTAEEASASYQLAKRKYHII